MFTSNLSGIVFTIVNLNWYEPLLRILGFFLYPNSKNCFKMNLLIKGKIERTETIIAVVGEVSVAFLRLHSFSPYSPHPR